MRNRIPYLFLLATIVLMSCKTTKYSNLENGLFADIQTDKGSILLELEFKNTPITVANFVSLAKGENPYVKDDFKGKPFYKGLKFHRVIKDFMIQGGDPDGNGSGGPGYKFEDEFPTNQDGNLLFKHDKAGILSMANSGPATNGSQFFITHKETPHLDGKHTVFGHVIEGQNVVDSIAKDDVMHAIKIIPIGKEAKNFNAAKIFGDYFSSLEEETKEKLEKVKKTKEDFLKLRSSYEAKAEHYPSGLKMYYINKSKGKKPSVGNKVNVNYEGYFTSGELFDSNVKEIATLFGAFNKNRENMGGYKPIPMVYNKNAKLIPGFKEGLLKMNYGDKVMLFIPSHLAYGAQGGGIIPPNSDLIFVLEIIE